MLREVAQVGSFSAAARALGYTQSAVSRQVTALEDVAGRRRFDRSHDGVILTPAGLVCWRERSGSWTSSTAAVREAARAETAFGPVRLGALATAAAGLVPRALATLPRELEVVCARERRRR